MMELAFQIAVAVVILIVILSMAKIKYRICRIVKPGSPLNGQVVSKTKVDDSREGQPEWTPRVGEYVWMDMQNGGSSAKPVKGTPSSWIKVLSTSGKSFLELTVNAEDYRKKANIPGGVDSLYPRFALLQYDSNLQPKAVVEDIRGRINSNSYSNAIGLYSYGPSGAYEVSCAIKSNGAAPVSTHFVFMSNADLKKRDEASYKLRNSDFSHSDKPKNEVVSYLKTLGAKMGIDTSGATEYTTQEFRFPSAYHFYGDTPDENGMFAFVQYTLVLPNGDQRVSVLVKDVHDEGYSDNL
jgi:hypothetical protein